MKIRRGDAEKQYCFHSLRALRLCGVLLFVLALAIGAPGRTLAYQSFLIKAKKFGAKDCLFCHKHEDGGEGWNERGQWLIDQKEKRQAEKIDVEWLVEYQPEDSDKKEKP